FAGAAPLAGGITRMPFSLDRDTHTRALLDNGPLVPFFVVHGTEDRVVRYDADLTLIKQLKKLGASVEWRALDGVGHMLDGVPRGSGEVGQELVHFLSSTRR